MSNKQTTINNLTGVNIDNNGNVLMWDGTNAQYTQLKTHDNTNYIENDYNNVNRLISKIDYTSFVNNLGALKPLWIIVSNNNFVLLDDIGGIKDSNKTFLTSITGTSENIPTENAIKTFVENNNWLLLLKWQN